MERFGRQPAAIARLMAMLAYYLAAHPKGAYREQAEWPTVVALCAAVSALKMKLIQGRNLGEYGEGCAQRACRLRVHVSASEVARPAPCPRRTLHHRAPVGPCVVPCPD